MYLMKVSLKISQSWRKKQISKYRKHRVQKKINPKRPTPSSIIIKMAKVKERILKAAREKQRAIYKGTPYKVVSWFFSRNMPLGSGMIYLKCWRKKPYNLEYSTEQSYLSELKDRQNKKKNLKQVDIDQHIWTTWWPQIRSLIVFFSFLKKS